MARVLRTASPAEFVGVLPVMLGYTPKASIVVTSFVATTANGVPKRTNGTMRVDIPESEALKASAEADEYTELLDLFRLPTLAKAVFGAGAIGIAVYGSGEVAEACAAAIELAAERNGLDVLVSVLVTDEGWRVVGSTDPLQPVRLLEPVA